MLRHGSLTLTLSLLGLHLSACDSTGSPYDANDDGGPGSTNTAGDARVGDTGRWDGGTGCLVVTVDEPPVWSCSPEQIAEASRSDDDAQGELPSASAAALQVSDCAGLAALRRPLIKNAQRAELNAARKALLRRCLPTKSQRFVLPDGRALGSQDGCPGVRRDAGVSYRPPTPVTDDGAQQYSTTNVQVAGVDEADFVKNDAGYVYVLSSAGLQVFDAWPAPATQQIAQVPIDGVATRLFLAGDKLVVYARIAGESAQRCTYGYGCRAQAEPGGTEITVFDVSTPASPSELRRYALSGGYVASRRVGNLVYTVVTDQITTTGANTNLEVDSPTRLDAVFETALREANARVDAIADEALLPSVRMGNGPSTQALGCQGGLSAQAASGVSFTSLIAFDLTTLEAPQRTFIATKPGFVYASGSALYLATDGENGAESPGYRGGASERSTIHKFALEGLATPYKGSTLIPGHVLNQFSMDERDAVLRVATSSGWVPDPNVSSNVVTLGERDGTLAVLGKLEKLAPQEDIRSVRFDGTRGFVVTFKKTDPLFVIDLANVAQPRVLGELKIPGFSTYMHPLDTNHVLAIGFDADDQGDFAYFDGIQLQIFDVSELSNPKLKHKTVIGTRGSASEALTDHLAFNYFAPKGLLSLPMTVCDGGGDGNYADRLTFSGLMVFDVSLSAGITERGRMPFVEPETLAFNSCSAWWTDASSLVKRSIIMDDFVIGLSDSRYQVANVNTLGTVLQSLPLGL